MVRENQLSQLNLGAKELQLFKNGHVLVECNLLDYPLCILLKRNPKKLLKEAVETGKSHIHYEIVDDDGTKRIWQINPDAFRGYTTAFDKDVVFAVFKLVTDEQFPPPLVWKLGSCKRICETLKIVPEGKNLKRVRRSLQRIASTPIYAETFYLKKQKAYWRPEESETKETQKKPEPKRVKAMLGGVFTLWSVFWKGQELPNGEIADAIYLQFNIPCILGLREFYVRPLDWNYWLTLSPLQKRIYELTGRKFFGLKDSPYVKYDYPDLCQALPILPQKHFSKAQTVFGPVHAKLKADQWLKDVEWIGGKEHAVFDPKHPWQIRYYPGVRAKLEIAQGKERLRRFLRKRNREELSELADVRVWVAELTQTLQDHQGKNLGFYTKISKLITGHRINPDLVWHSLSVAKTAALEGRARKGRSAVFTDELKRGLKARGQELKELLKQV